MGRNPNFRAKRYFRVLELHGKLQNMKIRDQQIIKSSSLADLKTAHKR